MDTGPAVVVVLMVLAVIAATVLLVGYGRRYRLEQQRLDQEHPTLDSGGWHGPSASGGFPAVPSQRTGEHDRAAAADQEPG